MPREYKTDWDEETDIYPEDINRMEGNSKEVDEELQEHKYDKNDPHEAKQQAINWVQELSGIGTTPVIVDDLNDVPPNSIVYSVPETLNRPPWGRSIVRTYSRASDRFTQIAYNVNATVTGSDTLVAIRNHSSNGWGSWAIIVDSLFGDSRYARLGVSQNDFRSHIAVKDGSDFRRIFVARDMSNGDEASIELSVGATAPTALIRHRKNGSEVNKISIMEDGRFRFNGDDIVVLENKGSTPQGRYVRYSDGTQICYAISLPLSFESISTLNRTWTLPASFIEPPSYHVTLGITDMTPFITQLSILRCVNRTSTSCRIDLYRQSGSTNFASGDTAYVQLLAIGRWK